MPMRGKHVWNKRTVIATWANALQVVVTAIITAKTRMRPDDRAATLQRVQHTGTR